MKNKMNLVQKSNHSTLDSREVSKIVGKRHADLTRDIRVYCDYLAESKIALGDYFQQSSYFDGNQQKRSCYQVTKKGCELIANKMTGKKGVEFTIFYIERFHEM